MPQLLVSVRNLDEARLAAGPLRADLIDVKEPARGSLGTADEYELLQVIQALGNAVPLSAALGELLGPGGPPVTLKASVLRGLRYAKFGLAGCAAQPDWERQWAEQVAGFPPGVAAVAVVYADAAAAAPCGADVLAAAVSARAEVLLVDTWDKRHGHLLSHWSVDELKRFVYCVHAEGLKIALAGSLDVATIEQVLPLEPDLVAVRGAVCRGGRTGKLDANLVRQLAATLHQPVAWTCRP